MKTSAGSALARGGLGFSVSLLLGAGALASLLGWGLHADSEERGVAVLEPEPREVVVVPEPVLGGWVVDVEPGGVR